MRILTNERSVARNWNSDLGEIPISFTIDVKVWKQKSSSLECKQREAEAARQFRQKGANQQGQQFRLLRPFEENVNLLLRQWNRGTKRRSWKLIDPSLLL